MGKFIWQDWLIIISMVLNLGARIITNYVTTTLSNYVAYANVIETNSVVKASLGTQYLIFVEAGIAFAIIAVVYLVVRKRYLSLEEGTKLKLIYYIMLNFAVLIFFILALLDVGNDLGVLLGILFNK